MPYRAVLASIIVAAAGGFREKRTAAPVADRLRALKFDEVRTGLGVTGVVGVLKGARPEPVVARSSRFPRARSTPARRPS
jgi:hypothetical protein